MTEPAGVISGLIAIVVALLPQGWKYKSDKVRFERIEEDVKKKVDENLCDNKHIQIVNTLDEIKKDFKEERKSTNVKLGEISNSLARLEGKLE